MATIGLLTEFAEGDGDWIEYVERLECFFLANDISDEGKKRSVLLSACGARTYKLIRNLTTPRKPGDFSFKELVMLVQNHHCPKPSMIVQQFKFHTHSRKPGVSVAAYVAELRQLSEHCEFGGVLDDMLCNRLVCGINDDGMQPLEIAQAVETAANNTKDIWKANGNMHSTDVHHVSQSVRGKPRELVECYRCGGAHFAKDCVFKESTCHNCKKKGYLGKKCRSTKEKPKKEWKTKPKLNTHHLQSIAPEEDECPIYATIQVNGKELQMEVDTGASASVISQATYHSLWHSVGAPAHQETEISLRQYTGECILLLGAIEVHAAYQGQETAATLLVVKGEGPSLLGRDLLQKIRLNWREIRYVTVIAELLGKYADVFKNELGTLRGTTVKRCVDPFARPRFFKPRTVPYAMKAKVEAELERLQQLGVIEPIEFSDWAALIVPVLKKLGCFLPDLSCMLAPLYGLLHKDSQLRWSQANEKAFRQVKELLQSAPLLVHFDPEKEVVLSCDASPYGIGAVLSHRMEDGEEKPVGYASRTLTAAEKGYSQLEKEGLAIVFAVKQFHQYLYGCPFTVVTDHKPLLSLFSETKGIPPMASARVQRWALTLSAYQYRIVYKAGPENANPDAFSLLPLPEIPGQSNMPPETVFLLDRLANSPDPELSQVKQWLLQGWPATVEQDHLKPYAKRQQELSVQDGCILWGSRVIVPPPGRSQIIEVLHEAHSGISRMESLARSFVWWSGMDSALEEKVKACSQCQSNQKMLHLDFAGPILGHMFLVLVDAHSEWLDAHITPTITALVVTDTLWRIFATHGLPEAVVMDNGPTFTSGIFQEFMERNGIRHIRTAPYHPASNGLAERAVETLKDGLKKMLGLSIEKRLCRFLFQYRITPHTTTGLSPAELLMGRKPRSHLDLLSPDVGAKVTQSQGEQKVRHDLHARGCVFKQTWLPGVIHHSSGPVSFVVELLDGRRVRRHKDHVRARTDGAGKRAQSCSHAHGGDGAVDIVGPPSGIPEGEVVSAAPEIGIGSSV
ncbi:interleukin 1 receptor-like 1 [Sarotherodon galilaeus]